MRITNNNQIGYTRNDSKTYLGFAIKRRSSNKNRCLSWEDIPLKWQQIEI